MKHKTLWVPLVALGLLVGCGNNQAKTKTDTTSSKTRSSKSAKQAPSRQSSHTPGKSKGEDRLTTMNDKVRQAVPDALVPTSYPLPSGQYVNVSIQGDNANYQLYYAHRTDQLAFNAPEVNENAAATKLTKQTFQSEEAAEAQINYQAVTDAQVPLGDNQKAFQQGAAGSSYTTWNEGNWSITVQAINQANEDGLALAKDAVALFKTQALPTPAGHGAVMLRVSRTDMRLNTLSWRQGKALYTISDTDAMHLLQVATALK